jgi:uncharacterized damage-inducible protein DinB
MTVKDLDALYEYNRWANSKIMRLIAQLSPEQFTQTVAGAYGSVRNTMVHIFSAEWGWADRCGGPARGERLNAADYPTIESVVTLWNTVEGHVRGFLGGLKDEDLARRVEFSFGQGPKYSMRVEELMEHAVIHAIHHRGQVALLLRSLGLVPGNFDMMFFFAEVAGRSPA